MQKSRGLVMGGSSVMRSFTEGMRLEEEGSLTEVSVEMSENEHHQHSIQQIIQTFRPRRSSSVTDTRTGHFFIFYFFTCSCISY